MPIESRKRAVDRRVRADHRARPGSARVDLDFGGGGTGTPTTRGRVALTIHRAPDHLQVGSEGLHVLLRRRLVLAEAERQIGVKLEQRSAISHDVLDGSPGSSRQRVAERRDWHSGVVVLVGLARRPRRAPSPHRARHHGCTGCSTDGVASVPRRRRGRRLAQDGAAARRAGAPRMPWAMAWRGQARWRRARRARGGGAPARCSRGRRASRQRLLSARWISRLPRGRRRARRRGVTPRPPRSTRLRAALSWSGAGGVVMRAVVDVKPTSSMPSGAAAGAAAARSRRRRRRRKRRRGRGSRPASGSSP